MSFLRLFLKCASNSHPPIELKHKEQIIFGRSEETKITDAKISRKQVELCADLELKIISVRFLGKNLGQLNDILLERGKVYQMKLGDFLYLLKDKYKYYIELEKISNFLKTESSEFCKNTKYLKLQNKKLSENYENSCLNNQNLKEENKNIFCLNNNKTIESRMQINNDMSNKELNIRTNSKRNIEFKDLLSIKKCKISSENSVDNIEIVNNEEEETRLIDVQEKLKLLKENLKTKPNIKINAISEASKDVLNTPIEIGNTKNINDPISNEVLTSENDVLIKNKAQTTEHIWKEFKFLLIYTAKGVVASNKVASFDLDGTIITTQSGKVFPTSVTDWKFLSGVIPGKLRSLFSDGYKIVLFSNQMGLHKGKLSVADFKKKVESICEKISVPIQAFISSGPGEYRKPCPGMWNYLYQKENSDIEINKEESFYVGDAAGRIKDWLPGRKKDFSCGDRLYALNIGLKFMTPEEFFLDQISGTYKLPLFDIKTFIPNSLLLNPSEAKCISEYQEIIVMVGIPASGKSHFVKSSLLSHGYIQINRDTLGTWQKCVQKAQEKINKGHSIVIDNTNPDVESRKRYIDLTKTNKIKCRCFIMNTSFEHASHNERFRELTDKSHQMVNAMVFNSYKSKFQEPSKAEGFDDIIKVDFVPCFSSKKHEDLYKMYLLEK